MYRNSMEHSEYTEDLKRMIPEVKVTSLAGGPPVIHCIAALFTACEIKTNEML